MWAMIIAKIAKYLVWVKNNLRKVSLSVVVELFFVIVVPRASNFCVCETCPVFARVFKRGWGLLSHFRATLAGPAWGGSGGPAQPAAVEANTTVVQEQHRLLSRDPACA